ncbi:ATP-binding protein [Georgenia satyanarayanai]|uniref:ATP-binding protein n=1 Tax=Georgenia satyanarayanai TaxID=860221 RepID=UPI00203BFBA4|nr:ATP-binding protein [Georgenia satyanarayanai]MCM3660391.1 ATP-binding protein [Georgenia satyanarayanai]
MLGSWPLTQPGELAGLRHSVTEVLDDGAGRSAREEQLLLLVMCELATNALRHGAGAGVVTLSQHGPSWLVDVRDRACDETPAHRPTDDGRAGGHGLRILDRATTEWGWYPEPGRGAKHVWALVPTGRSEAEDHR